MMLVWGLVIAVLLTICWQDYKFRAVHWWLFLFLFLGLGYLTMHNEGTVRGMERMAFNAAFIIIQLIFLTIYFSLKQGQAINIFKGYFGLGDLCFLLAISVYFTLVNFVLFYSVSLLVVIVLTALINGLKNNKKIPLAGYQSFLLFLLLIVDRYHPSINLNAENALWKF